MLIDLFDVGFYLRHCNLFNTDLKNVLYIYCCLIPLELKLALNNRVWVILG